MQEFEFDAVLKEGNRGGVFVDFPWPVFESFGTRGQVRVCATIDGQLFRLALAPMGGEFHAMGLRREIREAIGKKIGDTVHIMITRDTEPRTVEIPEDVRHAFEQNPGTSEAFNKLSFTHQKEHINAIKEARKPETRTKRIAGMMAKLMKGDNSAR